MFADSSPMLDRKLDEHNGALKGATVKEPLGFVAKNRVDDYENCYGAYAGVSR